VPDSPSLAGRALSLPRISVGVTTAALVALASSGTGLLVTHSAQQLAVAPVTASAVPQAPAPAQPVLVDRAPGSLSALGRAEVETRRALPAVVPAPRAAAEPTSTQEQGPHAAPAPAAARGQGQQSTSDAAVSPAYAGPGRPRGAAPEHRTVHRHKHLAHPQKRSPHPRG
jgi:hypothetical protein